MKQNTRLSRTESEQQQSEITYAYKRKSQELSATPFCSQSESELQNRQGTKSEQASSLQGADLTLADIKRIVGAGNSKVYSSSYYGEYKHNGRRMVRRDVFMHRREMGLDVCVRQ